ncbi:MAG: DUF4465 domain-containing protein [Bacteroidales bacterium]|nr:DUF4465 domain-containing protein [Bacteroidales bacterium]
MIRNFIVLITVAFMAASCLGDASYSNKYTADITFDFDASVYKNLFGADSTYVLEGEDQGFYYDPSLIFGQTHDNDTFLGGFILSYLTGESNGLITKPESVNDRYRVHAATGSVKSTGYVVFYDNPDSEKMPDPHMAFTYRGLGTCTIAGCYVNNTTLVARKVKEHFQDGDKLTLKATGYLNDKETGVSSITLAQYTEAKDSVMYNWSAFDMSKLGAVDKVMFEVESTNDAVPGYVCIDGVLANIDIKY